MASDEQDQMANLGPVAPAPAKMPAVRRGGAIAIGATSVQSP